MDHKFKINVIRQIEAHFAMNPQYKREKDKPVEIAHKIEIAHEQKDDTLHVIVSFSSDSEKQPFRFAVTWEGFFRFAEVPSKAVINRVANINCAAIIFPYIRESVADLTRRANIPPLHVPPINFVGLFIRRQKEAVPRRVPRLLKKVEA